MHAIVGDPLSLRLRRGLGACTSSAEFLLAGLLASAPFCEAGVRSGFSSARQSRLPLQISPLSLSACIRLSCIRLHLHSSLRAGRALRRLAAAGAGLLVVIYDHRAGRAPLGGDGVHRFRRRGVSPRLRASAAVQGHLCVGGCDGARVSPRLRAGVAAEGHFRVGYRCSLQPGLRRVASIHGAHAPSPPRGYKAGRRPCRHHSRCRSCICR